MRLLQAKHTRDARKPPERPGQGLPQPRVRAGQAVPTPGSWTLGPPAWEGWVLNAQSPPHMGALLQQHLEVAQARLPETILESRL